MSRRKLQKPSRSIPSIPCSGGPGAPELPAGHEPRNRTLAAGLALAALAFTGNPATAQEVVELPLEDRILDAGFPEVYRIGDGVRDWELLTRVTSMGFDAQGNLHIGDWSSGDLSVLVVDPRGELVVRFGQPGDGPGDFRNATHALALPDGGTVVADNGHLAYQLFDRKGVLERWARYPGVVRGETPPLLYVRSADPRLRKVDRWEGGLLARVVIARSFVVDSTTSPPRGSIKAGPGPRTVLRVSLDGDEAREEEVARASRPGAEGEFFFGPLPGGRIAFSDTETYAVRIAEPSGRVGTVLVRPLPAREWDASTVRALKEYLTGNLEADVAEGGDRAEVVGMFGGLEAWRRRIAEAEYEGPIPLISGMETTWEGSIWILRTPARGFTDIDPLAMGLNALVSDPTGLTAVGPGPIDLITPGGEYLGTIPDSRMPNAFGPDGLVAYVQLDGFEVPTVVVRRLPEGIR